MQNIPSNLHEQSQCPNKKYKSYEFFKQKCTTQTIATIFMLTQKGSSQLNTSPIMNELKISLINTYFMLPRHIFKAALCIKVLSLLSRINRSLSLTRGRGWKSFLKIYIPLPGAYGMYKYKYQKSINFDDFREDYGIIDQQFESLYQQHKQKFYGEGEKEK